jgi:phosphoribosylformimino-5-aminoimidazole carboxamide ribonucleotide (ProFAR) isomerase
VPVTASGGVSSLGDLRQVAALRPDGVDEVIVGRALYDRRFTLAQAREAVC